MEANERARATAKRPRRDPTPLSSGLSDAEKRRLAWCSRRARPHGRAYAAKIGAAAISFVAVAVACLIFFWGFSHKMRRLQVRGKNATPTPTEDPFCCLDFLESLEVDRTSSPCHDFQQYVCRRDVNKAPAFRWNTWNPHGALTGSVKHPTAVTGELLRSLRRQCEALLDRGPVYFVREMTPLVLRNAHLPPSEPNSDHILLFMAFISLKLRIDAPVHISVPNVFYPTLAVGGQNPVPSLAAFNRTCPECVDETLSLIRNHTARLVKREELLAFEFGLGDILDSTESSCSPNLFRLLGAQTAWEHICLSAFDIPPADVRMMCTTRPGRIYATFKRYVTSASKSLSLASIVVHLLATMYQRMASSDTETATPNPQHRCLFREDFPNLWTRLYAEVLVTSAKNQHIRRVFVAVATAMHAVAAAANIVTPEGHGRLVKHVQGLSPFLPISTSPGTLQPPIHTDDFSAQFLSIKEYEFALEANRRHRHFPPLLLTGDPVYVSHGWLVVTPLAYALVNESNRQKNLMDLPVVGVRIAKALWAYVFDKENSWLAALLGKETSSCPHDGNESLTWRKQALETALALRTALSALDRRGWTTPTNASVQWQYVTNAEIFFLRIGNPLCDSNDGSVDRMLNLVLQRNPEFSHAFNCIGGSNQSHCLDV
ncbi:hypothetical protein HPB48_003187 [Haemaphysalis longicornis]|uniref:Uncharacterized protein n=1 Tax=Haemaphysalis longicornis TaxID=44386 RepID=A0A9J6H0H8_HAELO|nr:hypothetical protein HPB48_003187 [Haemaphysalis longicornis]